MYNKVSYLIKYSDIQVDMECLEHLDYCFDFLNSLTTLINKMVELQCQSSKSMPKIVYLFSTNSKAPYYICDVDYKISTIPYPTFCFRYISPAGNSRRELDITIDECILYDVISEIQGKLNGKSYSKEQRKAMTPDLRNAIKKRDNYTCCYCGNSVFNEPNLLLEVDHIIPVSKGGKTEASNLQTLCWRCNRAKSNN